MSQKTVIVSVTNDLTTDQRVNRVCETLAGMGFDVTLVGRKLKHSLPLAPRNYRTKRMRLIWTRGPLFYAEYNISLLLYLLFHQADMVLSNDLDTLLANHLAARLKRIPHVHDCHEYFRGVPELVGRPRVTNAWKKIEDRIFPKLRYVYAVNQSIADIYRNEYGNDIAVVRNVPFRRPSAGAIHELPQQKGSPVKTILYQGAINVDRGLEEAVSAMKYLEQPAQLMIIGTGDVFESLKQHALAEGVQDRVVFTGQIPLADLPAWTVKADIGLSIEKDVGINYHFCLPNKFLDYIQARVPVLVSPLPEMKAIVDRYSIGEYIDSHDPEKLAAKMDQMLSVPARLAEYRKNLEKAAEELCWENEVETLKSVINKAIRN